MDSNITLNTDYCNYIMRDSIITLQARLVDMESARIEREAWVDVEEIDDLLFTGAESVARQIASFDDVVSVGNDAPVVGVIDFSSIGLDSIEAKAVSTRLRIHLGRTGVFQVIERKSMDAIIGELNLQSSELVNSNEAIVQIGFILAANKMVVGSISRVGSSFSLQARLVDIETSRIEREAYKDVVSIKELLSTGVQSVALQLAGLERNN